MLKNTFFGANHTIIIESLSRLGRSKKNFLIVIDFFDKEEDNKINKILLGNENFKGGKEDMEEIRKDTKSTIILIE